MKIIRNCTFQQSTPMQNASQSSQTQTYLVSQNIFYTQKSYEVKRHNNINRLTVWDQRKHLSKMRLLLLRIVVCVWLISTKPTYRVKIVPAYILSNVRLLTETLNTMLRKCSLGITHLYKTGSCRKRIDITYMFR